MVVAGGNGYHVAGSDNMHYLQEVISLDLLNG